MNTKVIITADDQTRAGIESAKANVAKLGAAIGVFSALAENAISAVAELVNQTIGLAKAQVKVADDMDEMSTRMAMSIKDLVGWQAAAEMNGTSLEAMAQGTRMLAKHITENGEALRKAGVTSRDTNEAFMQLADLFAGMTDPVKRLDLATRLFGRGVGQQLLPMLVMGRQGLEEIEAETARYGEALTKLSPEAQKLNDSMYLMGQQFKAVAAENALPLVDAFNRELLPVLRDVAKEAGLLKTLFVGFGGVLKIGFTDPWAQTLAGAKAALLEFGADVERYLAKLTFGKVSEMHLRAAQEMSAAAREAIRSAPGAHKVGETRAAMLPGANSDAEAAALAALLHQRAAGSKAVAKTPLQKMIDLGERNLAAARAAEYAAADDDEEARLGANRRAMESARLQKQEADAANKRADAIKDSVEPLRVLRREIEEVNRLRAAGLLTADQASEAEDVLAQKFAKQRESMLDLKKTGQDSFGGIKDAIESMGNKAADTFAELLVTGKASFSDLINSWMKDIARLQAKKIMDPITKGAGDWLGSLVGNMFSGGAGSISGNGSVQGNADYFWDLHSGGIVGAGEGSGLHLRNLALFAGAPKYHGGGLAGDEVPAVLKRGEGVFTPGQMKALGGGGNVRVEVINPPGMPAEVAAVQPSIDVDGQVIKIVMREMGHGGRIARHMEGRYKLNPAAGVVR